MGRPRKEVAVAPKKRGRPKKVVEAVAPKKRGRPKKEEAPVKRKYTKRAESIAVAKTIADEGKRTYNRTKSDLVSSATSKAKSVAVTEDQLEKARILIKSLRAQDVNEVKRTLQGEDRADWDKYVHTNTNGTKHKALTEAVAQELGI